MSAPVEYATGALTLTNCQLEELKSWNPVYRTIFGFNRWETVKYFIVGSGKLNLLHVIKLYPIRFIFHLLGLNHTILYNLFHVHLADHYGVTDRLAFNCCTSSTRVVYELFADIALWLKDITAYYYSLMLFCFLFLCSACLCWIHMSIAHVTKLILVVPIIFTARSVPMDKIPRRIFYITFEWVEQSTRFLKRLIQNIIPH